MKSGDLKPGDLMEEITTDVLVIGSGLAGLLSALEAERAGLRVLIIGKFTIGMGTNTSLANGAFTVSNSSFSKEDHLQATLESGKGLNQGKLVDTLIQKGPEAIERLKDYGVPLVEKGIGYIVDRPEGSSQLPGVLLIKPLVERLRNSSINLLPGLVIFDLEFVQFYPFVLGEPNLSSFLLYPPYPREVRLFDEKGEDLLERFSLRGDINRAIIIQRDHLAIALYNTAQNGDVFFDLTQVPQEKWERYPLNFLKRSKFPFHERPFLVSPAAHFFMGGGAI